MASKHAREALPRQAVSQWFPAWWAECSRRISLLPMHTATADPAPGPEPSPGSQPLPTAAPGHRPLGWGEGPGLFRSGPEIAEVMC